MSTHAYLHLSLRGSDGSSWPALDSWGTIRLRRLLDLDPALLPPLLPVLLPPLDPEDKATVMSRSAKIFVMRKSMILPHFNPQTHQTRNEISIDENIKQIYVQREQ